MIIATVSWHVDSLEGSDLTYLTLGLDSDPDGRMDATSGIRADVNVEWPLSEACRTRPSEIVSSPILLH